MQHIAFVRSLEELPADSREWADTARGFVLLTLVERWLVDERHDAILSGLCEASALTARFEDSPASSELDSLTRVLSSGSANRIRRRRVGAALLRYSIHLAYRDLPSLADDVAEASLRCCDRLCAAVRWRACRLRGQFNRTAGELEAAAAHFKQCIAIGRRFGIFEAVARGRAGIVHVLWSRGNLRAAERHARRLLHTCETEGQRALTATAHHDLGTVLCLMKRYDEGIPHLRHAFEMSDGRARDRVVNDIAYAFMSRGTPDIARTLLETLVTIGSDPVAIASARINLIEVYAALGERDQMEVMRREIERQHPTGRDAIYFHLTLGEALIDLGDADQAIAELRLASELAEKDGFGQAVIDADAAMVRAAARAKRAKAASFVPYEEADDLTSVVSRAYALSSGLKPESSAVADGED